MVENALALACCSSFGVVSGNSLLRLTRISRPQDVSYKLWHLNALSRPPCIWENDDSDKRQFIYHNYNTKEIRTTIYHSSIKKLDTLPPSNKIQAIPSKKGLTSKALASMAPMWRPYIRCILGDKKSAVAVV